MAETDRERVDPILHGLRPEDMAKVKVKRVIGKVKATPEVLERLRARRERGADG